MSEATFEATEAEAFEATGEASYEGEGGEAYEGESAGEGAYEAWGEDARSRRRAQERRERRIVLERQRQARLRRPPVRPAITAPSPAVRAVRSEVRSLDLETKVALDSLRSRLNEAHRLAYRNAWAAEASVATSQVLDSFEDNLKPHDWARALIRGAPTLLLAPGKPIRPGVTGYLFDPRVAGGAVIAAIFAFGHFRGATRGVNRISVTPDTVTLDHSATINLFADPVDHKGNTVANITLTWASQDDNIASLDKTTGPSVVCTGGRAGTNTVITVTGGGATARIPVTVNPAD
jgi:hypothetical protein